MESTMNTRFAEFCGVEELEVGMRCVVGGFPFDVVGGDGDSVDVVGVDRAAATGLARLMRAAGFAVVSFPPVDMTVSLA